MEAKKKENTNVFVEFTQNESLVLYEWLSNFNQKEWPGLFEDQSEERILFDLESSLETVLSETFAKNYPESLANARQAIRDKE
jgi:hypothetical protein